MAQLLRPTLTVLIGLCFLNFGCSDTDKAGNVPCPPNDPSCIPDGQLGLDIGGVQDGAQSSKDGTQGSPSDGANGVDAKSRDAKHEDGGLTNDGGGTCIPRCEGKTCGTDGCGGVCGECPEAEYCVAGTCSTECPANCAGKQCGGDGCGGTCGSCQANETCEGGACVPLPCDPDCEGKSCGQDGCGGFCGACEVGFECIAGSCEELCVSDCQDKECGSDGCGSVCGDCLAEEACLDGLCSSECIPQCGVKTCGDDGCGNLCGVCPIGYNCQNGQCGENCTPTCGNNKCGSDGCGGQCGQCDPALFCVNGQCQDECAPDCTSKECGDDGCGDSCGECKLLGAYCTDEFQCASLQGSSCLGYCGGTNPNWPCSCDALCKVEGDCCPDICEACEANQFDFCP